MAEWDDSKTFADIDKEATERYNRLLKVSQEREKRLHRHYEWRGNKLPPFSIEPFPYERQRLAGAGMTDADRQARRIWLKDQLLAPDEPVYVKELYPRNPIKRFFGAPWDLMHSLIKPFMSENAAMVFRVITPRVAGALVIFYAAYYNVKYLPNDWTGKRGWHQYWNKEPSYPGDPGYPEVAQKERDEFFDRGFRTRSTHRD